MWTPSRRITRPYEKPPFEWTQRFGLDWRNSPINLDGLVVYWVMNEGSGNIVCDLSGNNKTGAFYTSNTSWTTTNSGSGVNVDSDGSSYYGYVSMASGLNIGASGSFSLWFKLKSVPADLGGLLSLRNSGNASSLGAIVRSGGPYITLNMYNTSGDTAYSIQYSTPTLTTGQWYHYAGIWTPETLKSYFNGKFYSSDTSVEGTPRDHDNVLLGYRGFSNRGVDAVFDNLVLYDRPLNASEIALLYEKPFCRFERRMSPALLFDLAASGSYPEYEYDGSDTELYKTNLYSGSDADLDNSAPVDDTDGYTSDIDLTQKMFCVVDFKFTGSVGSDKLILKLYKRRDSSWDGDEIAIWQSAVDNDGSEDIYTFTIDKSFGPGHYRFSMQSEGTTDNFDIDVNARYSRYEVAAS